MSMRRDRFPTFVGVVVPGKRVDVHKRKLMPPPGGRIEAAAEGIQKVYS